MGQLSNPRPWDRHETAAKLDDIVASELSSAPSTPLAPWTSYHRAAAVLSSFSLERLKPIEVSEPDALGRLLADSTLVDNSLRERRWTLRGNIRRQVLLSLASKEALQLALKANPDRSQDSLQRMLDRCILGELPSLDSLVLEELRALLQAAEWLDKVIEPLPNLDELHSRVELEALLAPFRYLASAHFSGRRRELAALRNYVEVLEPERLVDRTIQLVVRGVREILDINERPPLLVWGPGGIGKSALVARFVLEHIEAERHAMFPFVYLDFDRPGLFVDEPATLMAEAAQQLAAWYPQHRAAWLELQRRWLGLVAQREDIGMNATPPEKPSDLVREMRSLLAEGAPTESPIVFVIDTFEEVQHSGSNMVQATWEWLKLLQSELPRLRSIILGRAQIPELKVQELHLGELDDEAAQALLERHGIKDESVRQMIVTKVHGSPLSLKLAAEVVHRAGVSELARIETKRYLFLRMQENLIQGQLYERILDHIRDGDVRKLAYPGLVLRRVTAAVIQDVLAGPCEVEVHGLEHANELFEKLRREVSLVVPAKDGSLRHRPDVRQVMLALLEQAAPEKVREIHRRAIAFYAEDASLPGRAEEIYHRLALGEQEAIIRERWLDGLGPFLAGSFDELPASAQAILAPRIGRAVEEATLAQADLEVWEQNCAVEAARLLRLGRPERTLQVVRRRRERSPASPLYLLEARALQEIGNPSQARQIAQEGIVAAGQARAAPDLLDLMVLASRLDYELGVGLAPGDVLDQFEPVAHRDPTDRRVIEIGLWRLRTLRERARARAALALTETGRELTISEVEQELREEEARRFREEEAVHLEAARPIAAYLRQTILAASEARIIQDDRLFLQVAAELGADNPDVLQKVVRTVGVGQLRRDTLPHLADFFGEWETRLMREKRAAAPLSSLVRLPLEQPVHQRWRSYIATAEPDAVFTWLRVFLTEFTLGKEAGRLADLLREELPPLPLRLPAHVIPIRYDIRLEPDFETSTFRGEETITLNVKEATSEIMLNAAELRIAQAMIENDSRGSLRGIVNVYEESERLGLVFSEALEPGTWRLHLVFSGTLNNRFHGFYRISYRDTSGAVHTLAVTQFEATDARRAFPCWDEPAFKAVFAITLVIPEGMTAVTNTDVLATEATELGRKSVRFGNSVRISTHAVAFVVGELEATESAMVGVTPLRILCVPGKRYLGRFALDVAAFSLDFFERYYGLPYPGDKLDLLAIPDFPPGAMEHLGAVIFRETAVLVDESTALRPEFERVSDVVAHELAHMWFGELVTMTWWNGLWLKEAFATFMALLAVDKWRPMWHRWDTFLESRADAMREDGLYASRSLEHKVHAPHEVEDMFDILTYEKGPSLLRMLEQYLTPEVFRDGVQRYLLRHMYDNADTGDLWAALADASDEPVPAMMDSWVLQPGYPVVTVEQSAPDRVVLTQQRFTYLFEPMATQASVEGDDDRPHWQIPIELTVAESGAISRRRLIMQEREASIEVSGAFEYIVMNADGAGFYRVRYGVGLLDRIIEAMAQGRLAPIDRFNLVSDSFAMTQAGLMPVAKYLDLTAHFQDETESNVWTALTSSFGYLNRIIDDDLRPGLEALVRQRVTLAVKRLGWPPKPDESDVKRQLRGNLILTLAALGNDPETIERARDFLRYHRDDASLDPHVLAAFTVVLATVGGKREYADLRRRSEAARTPQEQQLYLRALAAFKHPKLIRQALELTISGELRSHDAPVFMRALLTGVHSRRFAWDFLKRNWETMARLYPSGAYQRMYEGVVALVSPEWEDEVRSFFSNPKVLLPGRMLAQYLEQLRVGVAFQEREGTALRAYLTRQAC